MKIKNKKNPDVLDKVKEILKKNNNKEKTR